MGRGNRGLPSDGARRDKWRLDGEGRVSGVRGVTIYGVREDRGLQSMEVKG